MRIAKAPSFAPAEGKMRRARIQTISISVICAMAAGVLFVPASVAASGSLDITNTPVGQSLIQAASLRFSAAGYAISDQQLAVIKDTRGYVVAPKFVAYSTQATTPTGGSQPAPLGTDVLGFTTGTTEGQASSALTPAGQTDRARRAGQFASKASGGVSPNISSPSPTYNWINGWCLSRSYYGHGYVDTCFDEYKMANDPTSVNHWVLDYYGTLNGSGSGILAGQIYAVANSAGSAQSWTGYAPTGDSSGGCRSIPVSVSAAGASFGTSFDSCENISIWRASPQVVMGETWQWCTGIFCWGSMTGNRGLEVLIGVSVRRNGWPIWSLYNSEAP
jgi:hypothetical protein